MNRTNCVYKIQCANCLAIFIGNTSRHLKVRLDEHKRQARTMPKNPEQLRKLEKDSAIALHAVAESHQIRFDEAKPLQYGLTSYAQRCTAESLSIISNNTCVNRCEGFELSPIWFSLLQHTTQTRKQLQPTQTV